MNSPAIVAPPTDRQCRVASLLAVEAGREWMNMIVEAGHSRTEIAALVGISQSTISRLMAGTPGKPTQFATRLRLVPLLERLAEESGLPTLYTYPRSNGAEPDTGDGVSQEQDGQLRLDAGIDVTPAAWLNDLIALHKAIGKHELVSGPKVRNVLEQIIRDLGGEV